MQETTSFEALSDPIPSKEVYERMAMDMFIKLEAESMICSTSSSLGGMHFLPYPTT
jgi:hypothetical protein